MDAEILAHANILGVVADNPLVERVKIGYVQSLKSNMALKHAQKVAHIINDRVHGGAALMEQCCWRPAQATYSSFMVGSTQQVLDSVKGDVRLPNPGDMPVLSNRWSSNVNDLVGFAADYGRPTMLVPRAFGQSMSDLIRQISIVMHYNYAGKGDAMDVFSYDWMRALYSGAQPQQEGVSTPEYFDPVNQKLGSDSIFANLLWNWSYQIKKYRDYRESLGDYTDVGDPNAYVDSFRDFYNWSCVVCLGAGFYDTLGMYDLVDGVYRANAYYTAIVGLLSDDQQAWLSEQYAEGFRNNDNTADAAPLQVSLGLTMQSQTNDHPGDITYPDVTATYGAHCHSAAEDYVPIAQ